MNKHQRMWSAQVASLLSMCAIFTLLLGLEVSRIALAAPIHDDARGRWTDTFADSSGLTSTVNTRVITTQGRVELEAPLVISQTDWSGGTGQITAITLTTNRYAAGQRVNPLEAGNLSLGFTAPISDPTTGLDQDSYPDLVFSNYAGGALGNLPVDSYLYYGSASGYTETHRTDLAVVNATANAVADLNNDGYLDIVFSRGNPAGPSYIYCGSYNGYASTDQVQLESFGTTCAAVADLNQDGYLDIVLCNFLRRYLLLDHKQLCLLG